MQRTEKSELRKEFVALINKIEKRGGKLTDADWGILEGLKMGLKIINKI